MRALSAATAHADQANNKASDIKCRICTAGLVNEHQCVCCGELKLNKEFSTSALREKQALCKACHVCGAQADVNAETLPQPGSAASTSEVDRGYAPARHPYGANNDVEVHFKTISISIPLPADVSVNGNATVDIVLRVKDNAISAASMFAAAFPTAAADEIAAEKKHVLNLAGVIKHDRKKRHFWVDRETALALGMEYGIGDWVKALCDERRILPLTAKDKETLTDAPVAVAKDTAVTTVAAANPGPWDDDEEEAPAPATKPNEKTVWFGACDDEEDDIATSFANVRFSVASSKVDVAGNSQFPTLGGTKLPASTPTYLAESTSISTSKFISCEVISRSSQRQPRRRLLRLWAKRPFLSRHRHQPVVQPSLLRFHRCRGCRWRRRRRSRSRLGG